MRGPLLTQDEANLSRQLPQVKGFLQEVAATGLKQCSGLIHHVMAACKENLDAGFDFTDPVEYRLTAHIRHNQIQNHQIDKSAFIDLVVLDLVMPDMSGEAVFHRIREIKPGIKVLFASGHYMVDQTRALLQSGSSDFLQKPFNLRQLSTKIRLILGE